jgi:hypothetical protein
LTGTIVSDTTAARMSNFKCIEERGDDFMRGGQMQGEVRTAKIRLGAPKDLLAYVQLSSGRMPKLSSTVPFVQNATRTCRIISFLQTSLNALLSASLLGRSLPTRMDPRLCRARLWVVMLPAKKLQWTHFSHNQWRKQIIRFRCLPISPN